MDFAEFCRTYRDYDPPAWQVEMVDAMIQGHDVTVIVGKQHGRRQLQDNVRAFLSWLAAGQPPKEET